MRSRRHLLAPSLGLLLSLVTACAQATPSGHGADRTPDRAPARIVEPMTSDRPQPRGAALLRTTMVQGHAEARAAVGLPPLLWDAGLAADAGRYAADLARTGRFGHSVQPDGPARQGENLWTGTRAAYAYREMIGHWVAERRDFVNALTPGYSRTGRWEDVVHYAQIVWRGTTRVGCATASNPRDDYLVCRYSPTGNVAGRRAY